MDEMATASDEERRRSAALVRAIDANPDAAAPATHAAICAFVDAMAEERHLPETVLIAFKGALARVDALHRHDAEMREQLRSSLVSACIDRYFAVCATDDMSVRRGAPTLRLVRDERDVRDTSDATASAERRQPS